MFFYKHFGLLIVRFDFSFISPVRMGCSSSTQTIARERSRSRAKPETNGASVAGESKCSYIHFVKAQTLRNRIYRILCFVYDVSLFPKALSLSFYFCQTSWNRIIYVSPCKFPWKLQVGGILKLQTFSGKSKEQCRYLILQFLCHLKPKDACILLLKSIIVV